MALSSACRSVERKYIISYKYIELISFQY
jgi:hypothetical protein